MSGRAGGPAAGGSELSVALSLSLVAPAVGGTVAVAGGSGSAGPVAGRGAAGSAVGGPVAGGSAVGGPVARRAAGGSAVGGPVAGGPSQQSIVGGRHHGLDIRNSRNCKMTMM
jgi:hypothetical protein